MQYLNELNENLQVLRDTNKTLKRSVSQYEKELESLKKINSDQENRINELESLATKFNDKLIHFTDVIIACKGTKKVEIIEKSDYCDESFETFVSEASLKAIKLDFVNYEEIANFLKYEIRVKTGFECSVTVGLFSHYAQQTWFYKTRKHIALKIAALLVVVSQAYTKFSDVMSGALIVSNADILEKSDQIDDNFEKILIELAQSLIGRGLRNSTEMAIALKTEIIDKHGKTYGTNWLVTVGYAPYYDICYSVRISKRKFLDFTLNDLRFTIFQTL